MVLSQLAWESGSPLFDAIDAAGSVPSYKDVALPSAPHIAGRSSASVASPLVHPRVRKLGAPRGVPESPLSALHDRHTSPGSNARRALFTPGGTAVRPIPIAPKPSPQGKGGGAGGGGVTVQLLSSPSVKKQLQQQGGSPGKDPAPPTEVVAAQGEESGQGLVKGVEPQMEVAASAHLMSPVNPSIVPPAPSSSPPGTGGAAKSSPLNPALLASTLSPPGAKSLPLALVPDILTSPASTILSPSKATPTTPNSVRPLIPTSPPIPSVTVTQTTPVRGQGMTTTPSGSATSPRPKRTGSLALFYRKMYQLAFIRIKDLCERLSQNQDFIQK